MELRQAASDADRDQTFEILRRSFNTPRTDREKWDAVNGNEDLWGLYDGQILLATAKVLEWAQLFGGRAVPMAGISAVGVAPEQRGRGHASALFHRLLPALAERGFPLSGLMPASTALYRGVGYEVAATWAQYRLPTRALHGLGRATDVPVRVATVDDLPYAASLHRSAPGRGDGWLEVADSWWQRFGSSTFDDGYGYVGDGGWTWYRQHPSTDWGYSIEVLSLVATTPEMLRALWHAIGSSSTMGRSLTIVAPLHEPLLLLLPEQELAVEQEVRYMLRVCDVAGAMAGRGYATGVSASVDVVIDDDVMGANAQRWRLSADGGKGSAEPGGSGAVRLGAGAFASLYSGWASTARLRGAGLLSGDDEAAVALDAMFASTGTPTVQQFF